MKFYYFTVILVGLMLFLNLAGMDLPSGGLVRGFNLVNSSNDGSLEDIKSSERWSGSSNSLQTILTGLVVATIVLGAFGRAPQINYLTAGLVFILASLIVADFIAIYQQLNSYGVAWISGVALTILGALVVGFFISSVEFWQGSD